MGSGKDSRGQEKTKGAMKMEIWKWKQRKGRAKALKASGAAVRLKEEERGGTERRERQSNLSDSGSPARVFTCFGLWSANEFDPG